MVDGKFNQNSILSLNLYLVTLQYTSASSNLIYKKSVCPNQCL